MEIYGTIGPACQDPGILRAMFREGMTGIRLNLSHTGLAAAEPQLRRVRQAAADCGVTPRILIDMQGPELRVGRLKEPLALAEGQMICLGEGGIPVPEILLPRLTEGTQVLMDDGKLLLVMEEECRATVLRGGVLRSGKSVAVPGMDLEIPAMTAMDLENLKLAPALGVTGVMQPFVRSAEDLRTVRAAMDRCGGEKIRLLAKIENLSGVEHLENFFGIADEIVIARGDLGNAMPLWELPGVQRRIADRCRRYHVPFMVVTQMLASMEHSAVPTRAEVSDIYRAVTEGCSSVMVTGETAVGEYPVDVIRYLSRTVHCAMADREEVAAADKTVL